MLNFTKFKEVDFPIAELRNEHQVKSDTARNQAVIDQLVEQGSLSMLPLITMDGVILAGRTGVQVLIVFGTVNDVLPNTIRVNQLPWTFDALNDRERREFWAKSAEFDWAVNSDYRVFLTNEELAREIKLAIEDGARRPEIFDNYAYANKNGNLLTIYRSVDQSVLQSDISRLSHTMAEEDVSFTKAGEMLEIPAGRVKRVQEALKNKRKHHPEEAPYKRTATTVFKQDMKPHFDAILGQLSRKSKGYLDSLECYKDSAKFTREMGELIGLWTRKVGTRGLESAETLITAALKRTSRTPKV